MISSEKFVIQYVIRYWILLFVHAFMYIYIFVFSVSFSFQWDVARCVIHSELVNAFKNWIVYILSKRLLTQYHVPQRIFICFRSYFFFVGFCCSVHCLVSIFLRKPKHFLSKMSKLMPIPFREQQSFLILIIFAISAFCWYLRCKKEKFRLSFCPDGHLSKNFGITQ